MLKLVAYLVCCVALFTSYVWGYKLGIKNQNERFYQAFQREGLTDKDGRIEYMDANCRKIRVEEIEGNWDDPLVALSITRE